MNTVPTQKSRAPAPVPLRLAGLRPAFFFHAPWTAVALTAMGCCIGMLALLFAATAYVKLPSWPVFSLYLHSPLILALNLLPPVLLIWLGYFLTGRAWAGFLGSFFPVVGIAMVNYFKIRLRSDPFLAADLRLAAEAQGIVGQYALDLTWLVWFSAGCFVLGLLVCVFCIPRVMRRGWERLFSFLSCMALVAVAFPALFLSPRMYAKTADTTSLTNQWSDVEVFVAKGCIYPFLYSARDMFPAPPTGYNRAQAAALLAAHPDADIPEEQQVNVVGIMLEAFCDFTDFAALADNETALSIYAPWHQLQGQSVSGNLLTNIFAGGTVDSEWGFLTGYTGHDDFRKQTDSYVWYLRGQGYQTFGSHPGHGWFYNRQNVNQYLGFDDYWFTENHYSTLVDPVSAIYNSDHLLMDEILAQLVAQPADLPSFSFSVSYQNHGPYEWTQTTGTAYFTPDNSAFSAESCHILNNYFKGIADTMDAITGLVSELEQLERPVVLVLFGDHKPWAGNGNSVYAQLGADFDFSTLKGFSDYYATPYLIWANSAAKQALGNEFIGEGGDFSPCFLMTELFDQCGWEGPGFMQLARQLRQITPLVHERGLYLLDNLLTSTLPTAEAAFLQDFLAAQYYREQEFVLLG